MKRILFLCVVLCGSSALAGDWNQWRGANGAGVDSASPTLISQLPKHGLKPVWVVADETPAAQKGGWSSPVVANGKLYLFAHTKTKVGSEDLGPQKFPYLAPEKRTDMTDEEYEIYEANRRDEQEARSKAFRFDETIYCLNAATGEKLWTNEHKSVYTRFSQSGTPAVVEGGVYFLGAGRVARCVDADSGKNIWNTQLPGEFRDEFLQASFAVVDGVAAVRVGALYGLDAKSGKILWTADDETKSTHSSPTVWSHKGNNYIVSNNANHETVCVAPRTGTELWRVESSAGNATPIVVGDQLLTYSSSRKGGLRCYQLSLEGAEELWKYQGAADSGSSPVVVGEYVYVQGEQRLACVNLETGAAEWFTMLELNRPRYTSLVGGDNKVIYAFDGVLCFEATPTEFTPLMEAKMNSDALLAERSFFRDKLNMDELEKTAEGAKEADRAWRKEFNNAGPLACATPALANGRLYIRTQQGVACYDLRK